MEGRLTHREDLALLDAAVLPTRVYAPSGDCIYANEAWERLWGLPTVSALRYNILRDAGLDPQSLHEVRRAFAGERVELPVRTTDGMLGGPSGPSRMLRSYFAPFHADDRTLVIERIEDVTDRVKEQETHAALLRALADMSIGIFMSEGTRILWANSAYEAMTGWALAELTSPDFVPSFINPDDPPESIQRRMEERSIGLRREERYQQEILRKDGRRIKVEIRLTTLARGPPPRVVGVLRAIE